MKPEARLAELKIQLPPTPKVLGLYRPMVIAGSMAYLSGHGPLRPDGTLVTGRLGLDLDVEAGYDAARLTGLVMLTTLQTTLGSLDKVKRLVKLFGLVRCSDSFSAQPAVINGCSELFRDVFGDEAGVAARSAVGANSLPAGMAVEIEAIFEVDA
jgi:enamine deaminase RidA (YjgF/YER057c/UK114 family)